MMKRHLADRVRVVILAGLCAGASRSGVVAREDPPDPPELVLQSGHSNMVTSLAVTPDARYLVSSDGPSARLWDLKTGELLRAFPAGDAQPTGEPIHGMALAPDGTLLATDGLNRVRLWETRTGRLRKTIDTPGRAHQLGFVQPNVLAVAGDDGWVRLFDARRGARLGEFRISEEATLPTAFAAQGGLVAVDSSGVQLWDARSGRVLRTLERSAAGASELAFSRDGRFVAAVQGSDRRSGTASEVAVWDVRTGKMVTVFTGAAGPVAFSPNGRRIVTNLEQRDPDVSPNAPPPYLRKQGAAVWDLSSGKVVRALKEEANAWCYSPTGAQLMAGELTDIRILDGDTGVERRLIPGFNIWGRGLAVAPDGKSMAMGARFNQIVVWDLEEPALRKAVSDRDEIYGLRFSPDGTRLAAVGFGGGSRHFEMPNSARTYRTSDWSRERSYEEPTWGNDIAFSPDGRTLLVSNSGSRSACWLVRWDTATGALLPALKLETTDLMGVAFSPDGGSVAVAGAGIVRLQDTATGAVRRTLSIPGDPTDYWPQALAVSRDGRVAVGGSDRVVHIWEPPLFSPSVSRPLSAAPQAMDFSDSGRLAVFDAAGSIWLRKPRERSGNLIESMQPEIARECAWLPDGRRLATSASDGSVRIWDADHRRLLATFQLLPPEAEELPVRDWIIYTPEGYYNCSPGAERCIRWRSHERLLPATAYAARFHSRERLHAALTR